MVDEIPKPLGLYGVLKFASESLGYCFYKKYNISIINLRLSAFRINQEKKILQNPDKYLRTWISDIDLVDLYNKAIVSNVKYGNYFGASDNEGCPYDILATIQELEYMPSLDYNSLIKILKVKRRSSYER